MHFYDRVHELLTGLHHFLGNDASLIAFGAGEHWRSGFFMCKESQKRRLSEIDRRLEVIEQMVAWYREQLHRGGGVK